jgi:hypothetical protein
MREMSNIKKVKIISYPLTVECSRKKVGSKQHLSPLFGKHLLKTAAGFMSFLSLCN